MPRIAEVELRYQDVIAAPPQAPGALRNQAASNDGPTVNSWAKTWVKQIRANREAVGGDFSVQGVGKLHGLHRGQACIVAGSGPSLAVNGAQLAKRGGLPLISCLHNFHFFEDRDVKPDFYISLDAGEVVLEEIAEGGKLTPDEYWARTADHTLIAYVGSHPDLLKKWQGKIYWYNAPLPAGDAKKEADEAAGFYTFLGSGGCVFGAGLYFAKAILGCQTVALVGADFSFDYKKKFHGWDSKYDVELGATIRASDVYGVKRDTWQSYYNFKCWFEYVACAVPGDYYNCTEGGILGAYSDGNIAQFKYMDLKDFLDMTGMCEHLRAQCERPSEPHSIMLF